MQAVKASDISKERQLRLEWLDCLKTAFADSADEPLPDFPPQGLMKEPICPHCKEAF
jgi:hypothetical protein